MKGKVKHEAPLHHDLLTLLKEWRGDREVRPTDLVVGIKVHDMKTALATALREANLLENFRGGSTLRGCSSGFSFAQNFLQNLVRFLIPRVTLPIMRLGVTIEHETEQHGDVADPNRAWQEVAHSIFNFKEFIYVK